MRGLYIVCSKPLANALQYSRVLEKGKESNGFVLKSIEWIVASIIPAGSQKPVEKPTCLGVCSTIPRGILSILLPQVLILLIGKQVTRPHSTKKKLIIDLNILVWFESRF